MGGCLLQVPAQPLETHKGMLKKVPWAKEALNELLGKRLVTEWFRGVGGMLT